ncbi:MAG: hypothetical protein K0S33_1413 [Bacteroidetes bacterium]|jgi:carbon monoxide dehydrogenase subunit G|nr:hypothetical protein [Bacteroidota bacterium]
MTIRYKIEKPIEQVYPYLSDMQKFMEVHPVIYKVDHLSGQEYLFYETLKVLFIPVSFSYKVSLTKTVENKQVVIYSRVQPGVYLDLIFDIEQDGTGTHVRETIKIKALPGIKQLFTSIIRKAHLRFFENLKAIK